MGEENISSGVLGFSKGDEDEIKVKVLLCDHNITFSKMTGGDRKNMLVKFTRQQNELMEFSSSQHGTLQTYSET